MVSTVLRLQKVRHNMASQHRTFSVGLTKALRCLQGLALREPYARWDGLRGAVRPLSMPISHRGNVV